jgi:hypothetical protein
MVFLFILNLNFNKIVFFLSKTKIYLSLGLHKGCQSYKEAFCSQREHPALQNMKFLNFSTFVGNFCPPGSGSEPTDPIRIQIRNPVCR